MFSRIEIYVMYYTPIFIQMNVEMLNHCKPWSAVFNIAKMQLDLQESLAPTLALRLGMCTRGHLFVRLGCIGIA